MTDKERIEVYVNELPKCCEKCPCCNYDYECGHDCSLGLNQDLYDVVEKKLGTDGQTFISVFKYETLPKECPLKTIQSIQNQRAVEALQKVKEMINDDADLQDIEFLKYADILNDDVDQLIKEYGGKE